MVFGANGAQGSNIVNPSPATIQGRELKEMLNDFHSSMKDNFMDLKEELAGKIKDPSRQKDTETIDRLMTLVQKDENVPPELAAEVAAIVQGSEELDKKRRKRRKFEEKIAEFAKILEEIDTSKLSEEEKKMLEEFKKNLQTMKKLSGELKLLEREEESLGDLVKEIQKFQENKNKEEQMEEAVEKGDDSHHQTKKDHSNT